MKLACVVIAGYCPLPLDTKSIKIDLYCDSIISTQIARVDKEPVYSLKALITNLLRAY